MKKLMMLISFSLFLAYSCGDDSSADHSRHSMKDTAVNAPANPHAGHGMSSEQPDHSEMIALTPWQQLLAGIRTDSVRYNDFEESNTALGVVAVDESTLSVIAARVTGRIDRLYARYPGDNIKAGDPLAEIYSEVLLAEQQDFVRLLQNNASPDIIASAKEKLLLHGLSTKQIATIEQQKKTSAHIMIYSNASGYLSSLEVREGQYLATGDVICTIASLDVVRVNAQVYTPEIGRFTTAASYSIESEAGSDSLHKASLLFSNPALEEGSKVYNVWLRVTNTDHALRPGMMVTVHAVSGIQKLVTVPQSAILEESGMKFTWVQEPDGMFSRRMVKTGKSNRNQIEITEGIMAGDKIVTGGIYLLNSEYILRKGGNSMAGMEM